MLWVGAKASCSADSASWNVSPSISSFVHSFPLPFIHLVFLFCFLWWGSHLVTQAALKFPILQPTPLSSGITATVGPLLTLFSLSFLSLLRQGLSVLPWTLLYKPGYSWIPSDLPASASTCLHVPPLPTTFFFLSLSFSFLPPFSWDQNKSLADSKQVFPAGLPSPIASFKHTETQKLHSSAETVFRRALANREQ